jgi:transketolase
MEKTPGIDMTSGSLGNGVAIGAGMALAAKLSGRNYSVYVIVGDGEMQEGVIWEGLNVAAAHKLDNLIVLVDKNGWQGGGRVSEIIGSNNIQSRLDAFGWSTQEIDGHDHGAIQNALRKAKEHRGSPSAIVCNCVKGKGLPFMENNNDWHKKTPTAEEYDQAVQILGGMN